MNSRLKLDATAPWQDQPKLHSDKCIFCNEVKNEAISSLAHCYAVRDKFPVTNGHTLVIPFRHVPGVFQLYHNELVECFSLLRSEAYALMCKDVSIQGYNIGVNRGECGGQTVDHLHFHLILRRPGDVLDPIGGVRNIIAGKGNYKMP